MAAVKPYRLTVEHTCDGRDHTAELVFRRRVKLGCGCVRHEGTRCDGTLIRVLTGGCVEHADDTAAP